MRSRTRPEEVLDELDALVRPLGLEEEQGLRVEEDGNVAVDLNVDEVELWLGQTQLVVLRNAHSQAGLRQSGGRRLAGWPLRRGHQAVESRVVSTQIAT